VRILRSTGQGWRFLVPAAWLAVLLAVVLLFARFAGSLVTRDAAFSITARSEVLSVEVGCAQQLVWDLPPGQIGIPGEGKPPGVSQSVSVTLRGGALARVRGGPNGEWLIDFGRSASFGCGPAADAVTATADETALRISEDGYIYRSRARIGAAPVLPLLLLGRVVIGEEIPFGSGARGVLATPMLGEARVEVRTPDPLTAQRRLIHAERIDPGGIVDSHACLDTRADDLPRCVKKSGSAAEGFIHVAERDDKRLGFDVQLQVVGERIGVRQQGGSERRILVSWWSKLVTSSWLQIAAACVFGLSALAQIWSILPRAREPGSP
jgi:hypothetical protein